MQDDTEKFIAITHFINPHQFWYTNVEEDTYEQVLQIEEDITNLYRNNLAGTTREFDPVIGSTIAVRFLARNKYIRARVDDIVKTQFPKKVSYIVWALDHGIPLETKEEYVRRLPDNLAKPIDRVRLGGIAKIVPAEREFNFLDQCPTVETKSKWSKRACECLETILSDAASIAFTEMFQGKCNQYWGDLHITSHRGVLFRASDFLINERVALKNADKFKDICLKRTTQLSVWQSNDGNSKFRSNTAHAMETYSLDDAKQSAADNTGFHNAQLKVAAWSDYNKRATDYSEQISNRATDSSIHKADAEPKLDGFGLKAESVDVDLKSLILSERGIHARNSNKQPREATLADFDIDDNDKSIAASNDEFLDNLSSVSAPQHSKRASNRPLNHRLMEMRKKHTLLSKPLNSNNNAQPSLELSSDSAKSKLEDYIDSRPSVVSDNETGNKVIPSVASSLLHDEISDHKESENTVFPSVMSGQVQFLNNLRVKAMQKNQKSSETPQNRVQTKNNIPAGFDFANLNTYKNKDHWHRKTTTRGNHHSHDSSISPNTKKQSQDFRFTRSNSDKFKADPMASETINEKSHEAQMEPLDSLKNSTAPIPKPKNTEHRILTIKNTSIKKENINILTDTTSEKVSFANDDGIQSDSSTNSNDTMYSARSSLDENNKSKKSEQQTPNKLNYHKTEKTTPKFGNERSVVNMLNKTEENPVMTCDRPLRTKYIEHLVLAHSKVMLHTSENLNKVYLAPTVVEEMHKLYIDKVYRIQSYAWSHMVRGNGLFIVNAAKSGKTWSYIPALCSSITVCLQNSLAPCTYGPLAIVIVSSADKVVDVRNHCARLLSSLNISGSGIVASYGLRNLTNTKIQLMESCAVLVATPSNLLRLFQDNGNKNPLFDPVRLQHIVIDDIDLMLERSDDFLKVFKLMYAFIPKIGKSKKIQPQIVVTSRYYMPVFKKLISISNEPLLLIGDFIEAAVYGKTNILLNLCQKEDKFAQIHQFIKKHPVNIEPLIVMCNSEEDVFAVTQNLTSYGISCIEYHHKSTQLARQSIEEWKFNKHRNEVIVCADTVFPELQLQNAQNLIHYSLAKSWTAFTLRFSSLVSLFDNLIVNGFGSSKSSSQPQRATALILLDEDNNTELPRLVEFFNYHGQGKHIHPEVLALSKSIQLQQENKRCSDVEQLCNSLLEFGECNESRCTYRHVLTTTDIDVDELNAIPVFGDIRLLVLKVFSPTHFSARLLEQRQTNSSKWQIIRRSDKSAYFAMKFKLYCMVQDNLKMHWPVMINDLVVCQKNDSFYRARVLESPQVKSRNLIQSLNIKVKFIDTGEIVYAKTDELFICPPQFQNFPAQAVDIRLIGILPFDNERHWDTDSTKHIRTILMDTVKKNECIHARIDFALIHTIWVSEIVLMERLATIENYVYRINLRRYLIDKDYGIACKSVETKIRNVIKEHGFGHILEEKSSLNSSNEVDVEDEQKNNEFKNNEAEKLSETLLESFDLVKHYSAETNSDNNIADYSSNISNNTIPEIRDISSKFEAEYNEEMEYNEEEKYNEEKEYNKEYRKDSQTEVCSFEDLIRSIQRSYELEAEDYDKTDENDSKKIAAFLFETKQLCTAILEENKKRDAVTISNKIDNNNQKQNKQNIDNEPIMNSIEPLKSIDSETKTQRLPPLKDLHPRPQTVWYETSYLIVLSIYAPDIEDYYLKVTQTWLHFSAIVGGVEQVLVLNFLGTIDPKYVSHELRGLNVVVRLPKSVFMKWPRLLKHKEKISWLTYNLNMINTKEMEQLLPQQLLGRVLHTTHNNDNHNEDSDNSDENERDLYETYTPIHNNEDIHDGEI